jgi:hypothetical protein
VSFDSCHVEYSIRINTNSFVSLDLRHIYHILQDDELNMSQVRRQANYEEREPSEEVKKIFPTIWTSWVSKDAECYVDFRYRNLL